MSSALVLFVLGLTACARPARLSRPAPSHPAAPPREPDTRDEIAQRVQVTATTADTVDERKQAYLELSRIGAYLATPAPGTCARLAAAPGCDGAYTACAYSASEAGSCGGSSAVDMDVSAVVELSPIPPQDELENLTPSETASPLPEVAVLLLSRDDELLSTRPICLSDDSNENWVRHVRCHVVVADACNGRVGYVCITVDDDGNEHGPPEADEVWLQAGS